MAIYQTKDKNGKVIKTKDGRSWYFRIKYKDIYGKTKDYSSPKYLLRSEALDAESKYRLSLHLIENNNCSKTFNDLFLEYQLKRRNEIKQQTLQKEEMQYNHHLKETIGFLTIKKLTINHYENLKSEMLKSNLSVSYINKVLGIIDRINNYSRKFYGVYSDVPSICDKVKSIGNIKKEMQFFTYEEYLKFDKEIDDFLYHTFFEFLYFMGTRQGETTALCWNDVDLDKKIVRINKTLTTKIKGEKWTITSPKTQNSNRTLPIPKKVLEDLKKLKSSYEKYSNFNESWFVFGGVRPLPETSIQKKKNLYCEKSGKTIRIHDFRHSCASLLINQGASIALVSKYLGHGNISITLNTYTHMYKSELDEMANILNKL